jgi:hypothetical protein
VEAVMRAMVVIAVLLAGHGAAADGGSRELDEVRGPSIGAVLKAAYASAGLDRDPGSGWIRRARIAGLIPWLTVRTARDTSWQEPQADVGHSTVIDVRATWRLDRLLFDSRELQVAAFEAARRRERRRLANQVIRSYFIWQRSAGTGDAGEDRTTPRVSEAIAELDALTDGWFSDELARRRRGTGATSATRTVP